MKLGSVLVSLAAALVMGGCSGNDGKIEVASSGAALTDKGGDRLFTVKLVEAREDGYALDGLRVKVKPDGKDAVDAVCTPADLNANGKLDKGDTMACAEPETNALGRDVAGKEVDVELYAKIDGSEERVGDATWTPE